MQFALHVLLGLAQQRKEKSTQVRGPDLLEARGQTMISGWSYQVAPPLFAASRRTHGANPRAPPTVRTQSRRHDQLLNTPKGQRKRRQPRRTTTQPNDKGIRNRSMPYLTSTCLSRKRQSPRAGPGIGIARLETAARTAHLAEAGP
jgi:hypothetical protein